MMTRYLTLLTIAVLAVVLGPRVWAEPPFEQSAGPARVFEGYWMGVDPVDGGDARRSLMQGENGRYSLAAHDTVLTLCGGTEHGFGSFDDGEVVGRGVMQSNNLTLRCFNNGASVVLHVRFELIRKNMMLEHATLADGTPVSTIVFHRVSQE
jgi:hypothetical protein